MQGAIFGEFNDKKYYNCPTCQSIYMDSNNYLTSLEEKEHYQEHNNDVHDPKYQQFVSPIVKAVQRDFSPGAIGLDYGCGTGPVITKLLHDEGYELNLYDPFFANHPENLKFKYDYIVCCEVMEHFHTPNKEFYRLHSLLKPGGSLYMKTKIYSDQIDFETWYYKNDPTHVFFYRKETLEWIQQFYQFSDLIIEDTYMKFTK